MRGFVGKAHNLIFNRGAIPWPDPLNMPAIHRRAAKIVADNLMRFFIGMRNTAGNLAHMWLIR